MQSFKPKPLPLKTVTHIDRSVVLNVTSRGSAPHKKHDLRTAEKKSQKTFKRFHLYRILFLFSHQKGYTCTSQKANKW